MTVYVNNIVINAGESFSQPLTLTSSLGATIDLTGYGVSSYVRKHPESSTKTAAFTVGITSAAEGKILISLASTITQDIAEGRYVYDMVTTSGAGVKNVVLEGNVLVRAGITTT